MWQFWLIISGICLIIESFTLGFFVFLFSIDNLNSTGKVKVNGELWSAISDSNIEKGETIKVLSVNGVKLKVEKVNEVSNAK